MTTVHVRPLANDAIQASDAATYQLQLPVKGKLHTLLVRCAVTNGATGGRGVSIFDAIDRIRVMGDGSEVLYTLTPVEIEKRYETKYGKALEVIQNEAASGVQSAVFPIEFGRMLFDREYWLPLHVFKQITLEVEYSPTIAADGGFATGTTTIDVTAMITPESIALPYKGTMVTRTIKDFTSLASGDDPTELDHKAIFRNIGVYAFEAAVEDGVDITRVILRENGGEVVLFDQDWANFLDYNKHLFGAVIEHTARLLQTDAETWNSRIGNIRHADAEIIYTPSDANDTFTLANASAYDGSRITWQLRDADITAGAETFAVASADYRLQVRAIGDSPSFFGLIPFMYDDNIEGWLHSDRYGKLEVLLTQGGAGATVRISTEQCKVFAA